MRLSVILILTILTAFQAGQWRLEKEDSGIKVYTREVEGYAIRQFSVRAGVVAELDEIEALMRDINGYADWMPDVIKCDLLEREDNDTYIYHMVINAPFPVADRDVVARMHIDRQNNKRLRITHENLPDYIPQSKKYVRIPFFGGFWEFTPEGESVSIRNEFLSDPGGSVPAWVINSFISRNPYNTVLNLKEQIE